MKPVTISARGLALLSMCLIAVLPACSLGSPGTAPPPSPNSAQPVPTIASEVRDQRGTVVTSEQVGQLSGPLTTAGATQFKVVYRSVSGIDGTERDVSGTVFVPPSPPPSGGWPVIAYGHGGAGITNECGPSLYPALLGYDLVVASLLGLGYVISLTDYEGLGHPGVYPMLEPRTAAFNMIDSVRAAREIVPNASTKWLAVGVSGGGQASWAANELAGEYGDGLQFFGSASLSPAVDLSGLPALAEAGWLTKAQQMLLPTLVFGLRATHPNLNPDDYLHGALARKKDVWLACTGPLAEQQSTAVGELTMSDSEPVSREATEALRQALFEYALPQRPATGPMLVITGGDDQTVLSQWVASAVKKACAQGDVVEFVIRPNEGADNLNGGPRVAQWLGERLAGAPPVNTCGA
jgi:Secretory lipase